MSDPLFNEGSPLVWVHLSRGDRPHSTPRVSFVCPLKDSSRVQHLLDSFERYLANSQDRVEILLCGAELAGIPEIGCTRIVRSNSRRKGHLIRNGVLASRGGSIVICDDDFPIAYSDLDAILRELRGADVVLGNRYQSGASFLIPPTSARRVASRLFRVFVRLLFGLRGFDTQCGLKAMTREAALQLFSYQIVDGFAFDIELVLRAIACGMQIRQVPVHWQSLPASTLSLPSAAVSILAEALMLRWNLKRLQPTSGRVEKKVNPPFSSNGTQQNRRTGQVLVSQDESGRYCLTGGLSPIGEDWGEVDQIRPMIRHNTWGA